MKRMFLVCLCGDEFLLKEATWGHTGKCPHCHRALKIPKPDDEGHLSEVYCPKCGEVLRLPADFEHGTVRCQCDHAFPVPGVVEVDDALAMPEKLAQARKQLGLRKAGKPAVDSERPRPAARPRRSDSDADPPSSTPAQTPANPKRPRQAGRPGGAARPSGVVASAAGTRDPGTVAPAVPSAPGAMAPPSLTGGSDGMAPPPLSGTPVAAPPPGAPSDEGAFAPPAPAAGFAGTEAVPPPPAGAASGFTPPPPPPSFATAPAAPAAMGPPGTSMTAALRRRRRSGKNVVVIAVAIIVPTVVVGFLLFFLFKPPVPLGISTSFQIVAQGQVEQAVVCVDIVNRGKDPVTIIPTNEDPFPQKKSGNSDLSKQFEGMMEEAMGSFKKSMARGGGESAPVLPDMNGFPFGAGEETPDGERSSEKIFLVQVAHMLDPKAKPESWQPLPTMSWVESGGANANGAQPGSPDMWGRSAFDKQWKIEPGKALRLQIPIAQRFVGQRTRTGGRGLPESVRVRVREREAKKGLPEVIDRVAADVRTKWESADKGS